MQITSFPHLCNLGPEIEATLPIRKKLTYSPSPGLVHDYPDAPLAHSGNPHNPAVAHHGGAVIVAVVAVADAGHDEIADAADAVDAVPPESPLDIDEGCV